MRPQQPLKDRGCAMDGLVHLVGAPHNSLGAVVSLAIVTAIIVILGLLGHATVVWIQRVVTVIFGLLTLVVGFFILRSTDWSTLLAQPAGPWTGALPSFDTLPAPPVVRWVIRSAD